MAQNFHIGAILSITTGCLMSPISDVYEILNFMTGDNLYTHQLPRASRECAPVLIAQHPKLAEWVNDVTPENVHMRIADAVKQFGEELPIEKMAEADHERIDPLSELVEKVHPDKIIVINS